MYSDTKRKITFHKFPMAISKKKEWLRKIRRDEGEHFKVVVVATYCTAM